MTVIPPESAPSMLTQNEWEAIGMLGVVAELLANEIVGDGPSRDHDMRELVGHLHAVQHAILAQAAARLHPEYLRLLGSPAPTGRTP